MAARSLFTRIRPNDTALMICDMQEKFRNHIKFYPQVIANCTRLLTTAKLLDMKVIATEQYPKGNPDFRLGHTVHEIAVKDNEVPIFEKTKFSMYMPEVTEALGKDTKSIVLCGIEAHVCVYQTALDFLEKGIGVHVVVDASSSRSMTDRMFAYKQLENAGAVLTTSECVILGLVNDSEHPKFKEVQKLVMASSQDTGLIDKVAHI
jgi:nicotinamidase-related amidase